MDKEKVIKGLKCLAQKQAPMANPCKNCGYSGRENFAVCVKDIAYDAIVLLKEQEWLTKRLTPTEPRVSTNAYGVKFYYCPHCQRPILKSGIIGRPRHCEDCGQAVKWE